MKRVCFGIGISQISENGFCSAIHKKRVGAICSDTTQLFVFYLYPNY